MDGVYLDDEREPDFHSCLMDRIHYAGHSVLTGSAIARALLDYAQALAQVGGSATVDFPTLNGDGSRGRSQIVIGPSSQIISDAEESDGDDLIDGELVEQMRARADRARSDGAPLVAAENLENQVPEDWSEFDF
ncbi:hypothetical protein G5T42_08215 [Microbacterium sp. 4R-513]|uniref:hypothetical protein n=1 Tax=Microbacterium sp. 4R-513 TaxID=2567934 RepID=UPI0013E171D5|nr:hypothetical protein [Microbacterium sp. 4R-513]QIG39469.1 hypothetical protein G5T42_08215 [Microbacterium sp. 4R-513]